MKTISQIIAQMKIDAQNALEAGTLVSIDEGLSFVSVTLPDSQGYFFQGHEADSLLEDIPKDFSHMKEEYLLATSQNW